LVSFAFVDAVITADAGDEETESDEIKEDGDESSEEVLRFFSNS
jgi:hypothetical protein